MVSTLTYETSSKCGYYDWRSIYSTKMPSLRMSKQCTLLPAPAKRRNFLSLSQLVKFLSYVFLNSLTEEWSRRSHMRMVLSSLEVKKRL